VKEEINLANCSDLTFPQIKKKEDEIILFAESDDPVSLIIKNENNIITFIKSGVCFREVQIPFSTPDKPVKVFATKSLLNPNLWLLKQSPGVIINLKGQKIEDNGLFGIKCTVDVENKETNPPEIGELIKIAQNLHWDINPNIVNLLRMVKQI